MAKRVFITAAEVSGDRHAAQLIRSLRSLDPSLIIEGHGGPEMAAAGAHIHRDTVSHAAMGSRGALRAVEVVRLLRWTKRHFRQQRPDLLIGVDSPSMNFHFEHLAHRLEIPTLQYVAPQLWAWAKWRMKKVRKWVDRLACILPFEEAYFRDHGVAATFVGHPLFDELPPRRGDAVGQNNAQARSPVIGLLPGSRKSEAEHNFPHLLNVAEQIRHAFPASTFLVPTTAATHPVVERYLSDWNAPSCHLDRGSGTVLEGDRALLTYRQNAFDDMVPRCSLCLTVSGTATLHVAGLGVPMIVVYRASRLTWHAAGRWLIKARTFSLVNLLANDSGSGPARGHPDSHIVPEFIPWFGSDVPVAQKAIELLNEPEKLQAQQQRLQTLIQSLDHPGASNNVARMAMEMMYGASAQIGHLPGK